MGPELSEFHQRLVTAERRLRVTQAAGLAAALGFTAILMAGPAQTQVEMTSVRAPFRVVDAAGKPLFGVQVEGGHASLRLYGPDGRYAARLASMQSGGELQIVTDDFRSAATLSANPDGGGNLTISSPSGGQAASLQPGSLSLRSTSGHSRIMLQSAGGPPLATLTAADREGARLHLYDAEGNLTASAP